MYLKCYWFQINSENIFYILFLIYIYHSSIKRTLQIQKGEGVVEQVDF
jgi:hypothetical protein